MPIIIEGEGRPKRGKRHCWLVAFLLPASVLAHLVGYTVSFPIDLRTSGHLLYVGGVSPRDVEGFAPGFRPDFWDGIRFHLRVGAFVYVFVWI